MTSTSLPLSNKPEIIRLHQLEETERTRYILEFSNTLQELLPIKMWPLLPLLADLYYTYTTICLSRRRLGEEYTYVAMYNRKDYEEEGVLVSKNKRVLMFVLEILQRHVVKYGIMKIWAKLTEIENQQSRNEGILKYLGGLLAMGGTGFLEESRRFMLMLFLLNWNKYYNLVDTFMKNEYVYTYMNKNGAKVDYRVEAYMLLTVFVVRIVRFCIKCYKISKSPKKVEKISQESPEKETKNEQEQEQEQEQELCRICYDNIKNKSVTNCGHTFCWECIVHSLSQNPQCPSCRSECEPREIVQLQNY